MLIKSLFKYWTYQVFSPGTVLRKRYEAFKSLLKYDKQAHELMAELEEIYHNEIKVDLTVIEDIYAKLSVSVSGMIENLGTMCPARYLNLRDYFKKFDFYIRFMLVPPEFDFSPPFTIPISKIPPDSRALVGGKAMNLAIIERELKVPIPKGFVITTNAFHYLIEFNDLRNAIDARLAEIDINCPSSLEALSRELDEIISNARIPPDVEEAILNAYRALQGAERRHVKVAMRSSAVGEDAKSSFAGQYQTFLYVGEDGLLDAYKAVIASKYAPRAIYYRVNYGLSDDETPMAVLVLEMIDALASGVIYTEDLEAREPRYLNIHSIWGLGEVLVKGEVSPDIIKVVKEDPLKVILEKAGVKSKQMLFSPKGNTEVVPVHEDKKCLPSLDHKTAAVLAKWGMDLEAYFKEAQDIEWCMDKDGKLFIVQSRSLRKGEDFSGTPPCVFEDIPNAVLVSGGERASSGIGTGKVFKLERESDLVRIPEGAVLVARNASPHYVQVMGRLSAVVTDTGSSAGHFSSVAREFGVPTLVNTGTATRDLTHGKDVTVYADGRVVYDGIVQSMLNRPCARRNLLSDSPFKRKLKYMMSFISPLKLVNPNAPSFVPEACRSLHDIIRFVHEKAVQEMFTIGDKRSGRIKGARKLVSEIPMLFYVLDVGEGLKETLKNEKVVTIDEILSVPMQAVMKGLSHPAIRWSAFTHFDWSEFDNIVMSGGVISKDLQHLASYALISNDYLNLNLRFGYHFVILDTICGVHPKGNYILFRFGGGGGSDTGKALRAEFLREVLERLGFTVEKKGDLVDAQLKEADGQIMEEDLDMVGRLLGATRLMDMYLKEDTNVPALVNDFMNGRYHFAPLEESIGD